MASSRSPKKDPRTVARDIPGILDALFPQLTAGTVLYFNSKMTLCEGIRALPSSVVNSSNLQHAMLFEIAYARGEQILAGKATPDWEACLLAATRKQRRYFDANIPEALTEVDEEIAEWVGTNMACMIHKIQAKLPDEVPLASPMIPGYQWISSGEGDFAIGQNIIEIKCTNRNFGSADYRQILMYWLLSYASAIESGRPAWKSGILLNPRLNHVVNLSFEEMVSVTGAGKSMIEILELFSSVVGDEAMKLLPEFKL